MRKTKNVRFRETVDVFITPSSQVTDTEDNINVTDVALDLANNAIAAAVQIVQDDQTIKNIKWITHGEFTAERGRKQIEAFVLTWDYHDHWAHYTKLVEKKDMVHSFYYIYVVRWSIPTANTPTALSSASAYFTIKINKNKPPDAPIDVSYIFEGQSLVHRPGMSYFREQWQREFIEARHIFMESVPF